METQYLTVPEEFASLRLDKLLKACYPEFSRTYFEQLIKGGHVKSNDQILKKKAVLEADEVVEIDFQPLSELTLIPEDIPLEILYEDDEVIAVNKPAGMVTHPAPGSPSKTFANALLFHCQKLEQTGDPLRPGIVHRLDKETSGVLIAAKTAASHEKLSKQFAERTIEKTYLAITNGNPGNRTIEKRIGRSSKNRQKMAVVDNGREAVTKLETLCSYQNKSLVKCSPKTGRTHQIRVHLQSVNAAIIGDKIYSNNDEASRHLLHAWKLKFKHPISGDLISLEAPIPGDMLACEELFTML